MSVNSKTTRSGRKKIWSRLACVAIYYYSSSCSLQSAEACPFFQKKIGQQKQQQSKTAGSTEDDCSSPHDDAALYSQQRRTQEAGIGDHYYGLLSASLPPLDPADPLYTLEPMHLDWAAIIEIAKPSGNGHVGYMEDSRSREEQLVGSVSLNNRGASSAAGHTYTAQLFSHDVNHDDMSQLGQTIDPSTIVNKNTPSVDLDCVYSMNGCNPNLRGEAGASFVVNGRDFDRHSDGRADICDPRNDNHRILSQITVAWMTLHNYFVQEFALEKEMGLIDEDASLFELARQATIREWQAVVLTDLMPNLLDPESLEAVKTQRVLYDESMKSAQMMPAEFSTAAYRLVHSRVRTNYRLSSNSDTFIFFDVGNGDRNLLGGSPLPADMEIEWDFFFENPNADTLGGRGRGRTQTGSGRIMDVLYVQPMMRLPCDEAGTPPGPETVVNWCEFGVPVETCEIKIDEPVVCPADGQPCAVTANLAALDMLRGQTHSLAGGIAFAKHVQQQLPSLNVLTMDEIRDGSFGLPAELATATDVPMLHYFAHESYRDHNGELLGELGSLVVAEVVYSLIETTVPSILDGNGFESRITGAPTVSMMDVMTYIGWQE